MKLEIDIPEEMLESEILDAIISVDTDNKIIKKVHIEPRADDLIKAFEALDLMNAMEGRNNVY